MKLAQALMTAATAAALPLALVVTPAQAQECYDDGYNVVNLGAMCGSQRSAQPQAAASAGNASLFPAWLFSDQARKAQPTRAAHGDNYSRWVYADRYVLTLRAWPFTLGDDNRSEFTYLDCNTLALARESVKLGGGTDSWAISAQQAANPASHSDTYGATCQNLGLSQ